MARELEVKVWCDECLLDDRRQPTVKTVMLTVGPKGEPQELDLCGDHLPPVQAVLDMLEVLGHPADQRPEPRAEKRGSTRPRSINGSPKVPQPDPGSQQWVDPRCKVCDHVSSTTNAMWQHARSVHRLFREAYRAEPVHLGSALAAAEPDDLLTG